VLSQLLPPIGVPALSDQLTLVAVTMGERLGSDDAKRSVHNADSAWLTHTLVTRLAPCRSAKSVQVSRRASSRKAAAMAAAMNRHMRPNPGQGPSGSAGEFWPNM
jgi:hypothetical protein